MSAFRRVCEKLFSIFNDIAAALILASMLFIVANVFMRIVFAHPLLGAIETIQYFTLLIVSFGLAYCSIGDGHIRVDIVLEKIPKRAEHILNLFTQLISIVAMIFVVIFLIRIALLKFSNLEVSPFLGVPIGLLYLVIVFGIALLDITIIFKFVDTIISLAGKKRQVLEPPEDLPTGNLGI
ncbi:MAG: TRAP transporter small permease [Clostridiales Family XIII bacterium]|jgi:TRAP-type C4-dicarboxylate transport system permease small subunit|nr:TRAP transporter small permease [Clostridiales Family XIII bacterium]